VETYARIAAIVVAAGLVAVATFQALLAAGAPLGRAAWGGVHERLPSRLRIASLVSAVVLSGAAVIVMAAAGVLSFPLGDLVLGWGPWVLAALLALSALGNLASRSRPERTIMGPLSLLLAFLCVVVALGRSG
jgi:hypothetical protein